MSFERESWNNMDEEDNEYVKLEDDKAIAFLLKTETYNRSSTQKFMDLREDKRFLTSLHMSCSSSTEGSTSATPHSLQENYKYVGSHKDPLETMTNDPCYMDPPTARYDVSNDGCVCFDEFLPRQSSSRKSAFSANFVQSCNRHACNNDSVPSSCDKFKSQNETKTAHVLKDPSNDSSCDGESLREWFKLNCSNAHKVACLSIFIKILDIVNSFHVKGSVLQDLRPSCFVLLPSKDVKYTGRVNDMPSLQTLKRPGIYSSNVVCEKREKLDETVNNNMKIQGFHVRYGTLPNRMKLHLESDGNPNSSHLLNASARFSRGGDNSEVKWYESPEELFGKDCTSSSNIYSLGLLLFELLSCFDSARAHAATMSNLGRRILPPNFYSKNPKEAGFCLWLLHPQPSLRPTIWDVLQSKTVRGFQKMVEDDMSSSFYEEEVKTEVLFHFLQSMKEKRETNASILVDELNCIQTDIQEAEKRKALMMTSFYTRDNRNDWRNLSGISRIESTYSSMRSQFSLVEEEAEIRPDVHLLSNGDNSSKGQLDIVGSFFESLCKYSRYSKLQACGTVRNGDFTNSTNVICSLSFDRDEEYLAAAGVSKKIKLYEFQALCNDYVDIHYPMVEMSNDSKVNCVSWNPYIRNYLASADYDGIVKIWDASTGQEVSEYGEHEKRAWSVDFSPLDPTKLASGSDDCTVRLWSINERNSLCSIRNIANACCVQYSSHSSHLLAFGSADYKIYVYDLRNANMPWCILCGHEKSVSYVKFLDSETLVSASTDNTLKRWDLKRSTSVGLSNNACSLSFKGHTNEKNFIGLSVQDEFIACGSETNEVFTYHKSFPMPITSHKFGAMDSVTGEETYDNNGEFVSSVCWRGKSNFVVAANSSGCMKVLRMT